MRRTGKNIPTLGKNIPSVNIPFWYILKHSSKLFVEFQQLQSVFVTAKVLSSVLSTIECCDETKRETQR